MTDIHSDHAPTGPVRYPTNAVLGVLDTDEQLERAVEELTSGGFLDSEIHVSAGEAAADRLRASTGRTGLAGIAMRIAQWIGVDNTEMEFKAHYEQAMRDGRYVVGVDVLTDARKERATEILRAHGADAVSFHGRFTIAGEVPPSES